MGRDVNEKQEKFKKYANVRLSKAVNVIRTLGNLANKTNYEYTEADAQKIHRILRDACAQVKFKFDENTQKTKKKNGNGMANDKKYF
tara:strand:+ start:154 stop:414 length:261 start_codon:yes stop_codon:yes gene_type:complete